MPIYEFYCGSCSGITEKILPITNNTKIILCEKCQIHSANRIISRNNFVLTGDGWTNGTRYKRASSEPERE